MCWRREDGRRVNGIAGDPFREGKGSVGGRLDGMLPSNPGLQSLALLALGEDVHRHGAQEHKTLDRLHHCGVDAHDRQALVDDAHDQCADNGAGKSTLVHVLAGLEQPDAGSIAVGGETVRLDGVAKAIDLGIAPAFQQPQFCENLDVSANIFLGREMRQGFASRDDEGMYNKAREVLNTLSTSVRAGQSIASLSGGQRQTIAIARTLLNDPSLIVLDEPTASLSVTQTAEVLDYIVRLRSTTAASSWSAMICRMCSRSPIASS